MTLKNVTLDDKYDLTQSRVFVTGYQALIRACLMQQERDRLAGLNTAGYVSGYRGSPLGGLDQQFMRAKAALERHNVLFQSGLNEDLAATAIWGTQQAELRGEGKYDGVFGMWYGKGPGVDRTGDVFRHANFAGSSKNGGVLALMGDDHTAESSTTAHQSEFHFVDVMIPILNPAGVQEFIDYALYGWAMSRFCGSWVALKCMHETVESTGVVEAGLDSLKIVIPGDDEFKMPPGGLNIRLVDGILDMEARLHDYKRDAMLAFVHANKLNRIITSGGPNARIGIITVGKSYLDVRQAFDQLGIDEVKCNDLGIRLFKIGCPWPISRAELRDFAKGLELIIVVEEKRSLIEVQVREELYGTANQPVVIGKRDEKEDWLFPVKGALDPHDIAIAVGERVLRRGHVEEIANKVSRLKQAQSAVARHDRRVGAHALFLLGLPAQLIHRGAAGHARLRGHRLPLHVAVDGPQHARLDPHGRRGRELDRRGAVLQAQPRVPESRRRHLQSLRLSGDPRGGRVGRQRHLQDPVQRCGRDDRRAAQRRRPHRADHRAAGRGRRREEDRHRHRRAEEVSVGYGLAARHHDPSSRRPDGGADRPCRRAGPHGADLRPDLRGREAAPPQARPVPRSGQARRHQRARLRGLRRLRRAVELRLGAAARDRMGPQAHHRSIDRATRTSRA